MRLGHLLKKHPADGDGQDPQKGVGPRRGCLSQDRPTRFVVACCLGTSEDKMAAEGVRQTRQRTRGQRGVPWASDGRKAYRREVARTYRGPRGIVKILLFKWMMSSFWRVGGKCQILAV